MYGHLVSERYIVGVDGEGLRPISEYDIYLPTSPDDLLRIIRCNCATTDCSTARSRCPKHDLGCSPACGQCRGVGCCNSASVDDCDEIELAHCVKLRRDIIFVKHNSPLLYNNYSRMSSIGYAEWTIRTRPTSKTYGKCRHGEHQLGKHGTSVSRPNT